MRTTKVTALIAVIALMLFIAVPQMSFAADQGADLYKAKCGACHGPDAAGKPALKAPAIKGKTAADIKKSLINPKHASIKTMTDDQIKAIADHLKTLK